jgi:hypothetical protein
MLFAILGGLALVSLVLPVVRFVLGIFILYMVISMFSGNGITTNSNAAVSREMTYEQLVKYPTNCDLADEQLAELKQLQRTKNFAQDPDQLSDYDRSYNGRLKATIWWYSYECNK